MGKGAPAQIGNSPTSRLHPWRMPSSCAQGPSCFPSLEPRPIVLKSYWPGGAHPWSDGTRVVGPAAPSLNFRLAAPDA